MGNDNEIKPINGIKELVKRESKNSLAKSLREIESENKPYNLETEFAKTKKNNSPKIFIIIGVSIAVCILLSVIANYFIQASIKAIPMDVQTFQDVNLRDLLDVSKKYTAEMDAAQLKLRTLKSDLENERQLLNEETQNLLKINATQKVNPSDLAKQNSMIQAKQAEKKRSLEKKYAAPIANLNSEVDAIHEKILQYDSKLMEEARKQKEVIDNHQKLYEIEKLALKEQYDKRILNLEAQRIKDSATAQKQSDALAKALTERFDLDMKELIAKYEKQLSDLVSLYNPLFTDPLVIELIKDAKASEEPYTKTSGLSGEVQNELENLFTQFKTVSKLLREIPYQNSVPEALNYLDYAYSSLSSKYSSFINSQDEKIKASKTELNNLKASYSLLSAEKDSYTYALSQIIDIERENGYIIDARKENSILVYINPVFNVTENMKAYVFRKDDEPLGSILLFTKGTSIYGKIDMLNEGAELRPFDKILLEITVKTETAE